MIKVVLDSINPEARVNTHNLKDKLRSIDIDQFKGDITKILLKMEDIYLVILAEGEDYQDFNLDLLNALRIVHDTSFLYTLE